MAKRNTKLARTKGRTATRTSDEPTAQPIEPRLVAFAEKLGWMVGTIQTKAEGWMDGETLKNQLVSVRDSAAHLLEQLGARATAATKRKKTSATAARRVTKGRSGGVVDAPGKKHRKQPPPDPGATVARSQAAKRRAAMPMAKTARRRGRG